MSKIEKEPLVETASRKSSASSSTESSFEKVDQIDSSENNDKVKENEEIEVENPTTPEAGEEENVSSDEQIEEAKEIDPLDAPMKLEQVQFYTDKDRARAIKLLIGFSAAMFTLPLLVMFSMYHYVFIDHYHLPPDKAMLYAAGCGITVVFAIVGSFIYIAYKEEVEAEKRLKRE